MFHEGRGKVHEAVRAISRALDQNNIDYAVVGGLAVNAHGYARETVDVDILVTPEGLDAFTQSCVGKGYRPAFEGARKSFRHTETDVRIEFLTTGEFPGDGKPKPVAFPDPGAAAHSLEGFKIIGLEKLIELKLASGMTNPGRLRDLADVQDLIRALHLDPEFAEHLDPYVRERFLELLAGLQNDLS